MAVTAVTDFIPLAAPSGDKGLGALLEFIPGATIWTWIAFVVALPVMWKMVYGPITKALEDRDRKVEDAIAAAEVARQQAEQQMGKEARALRQKDSLRFLYDGSHEFAKAADKILGSEDLFLAAAARFGATQPDPIFIPTGGQGRFGDSEAEADANLAALLEVLQEAESALAPA
jgi:hypothetical protein